MTVVTISRQLCSLGDELADALSRKTGWDIISRDNLLTDILPKIANRHELHMLSESPKFYLNEASSGITFIDYVSNELFRMTRDRSLILLGFGSQYMFEDREDVIRVRVVSSWDVRIDRAKKKYNTTVDEAGTILKSSDRKKRRFISTVFGESDIADISSYDMTVNTDEINIDAYATAIADLIREKETIKELEEQHEGTDARMNKTSMTAFKNAEEIEFARILDTYNIEWIYEPKTFPIEWDTDGNIILAFSPDFYLPGLDLYIELTIMNQKYVTRKNKKAKKLRELYPGINVKIVYKKDFQSLVQRFSEAGGA